MAYTVANQRTINIHRLPLGKSFLGINNNSWKKAARTLSAPAFKLYIYLAANKDDFKLALSPAALQQEIGMARSTFYDQFKVLEGHGYLVKGKGNLYHFYEEPSPLAEINTVRESLNSSTEISSAHIIDSPTYEQTIPQDDIEIYINKNIRKTYIPEENTGSNAVQRLNIKDFDF